MMHSVNGEIRPWCSLCHPKTIFVIKVKFGGLLVSFSVRGNWLVTCAVVNLTPPVVRSDTAVKYPTRRSTVAQSDRLETFLKTFEELSTYRTRAISEKMFKSVT